jgi:Putative Fe-S cluster
MAMTLEQKSRLVSNFWNDRPVVCPSHDIPMRSFYVERVFKPQVVMVCPRGEMFRFDQKPKQIVFSPGHLKTMVIDAQERERPVCSQDFEGLVVYRTPARRLPKQWDYSFICPDCLSYGSWINGEQAEEAPAAKAKPAKQAPAFHDETIPLAKRMEMAAGGDLKLKLFAAMAQTDCTACGYDCEGYAEALATGKEKDSNLCVPGKEETASLLKELLKTSGG